MAIFGKDGTVTYEGAVLAVESRTARIMSDVWAIEYYATVVEADGSTRNVTLGNDEFYEYMSTATVDAPQAVIEKWKAEVKAAQERALAEEIARDRAARAENFCTRIDAGRKVVVVRGRKVKVGTKGTVKIVRSSGYGTSALLATSGDDVWVNIGNLTIDHALLKNGEPISGEAKVEEFDPNRFQTLFDIRSPASVQHGFLQKFAAHGLQRHFGSLDRFVGAAKRHRSNTRTLAAGPSGQWTTPHK